MLLLVDGSNLLFQMFYGMPARIVNAQGRPIQGTVGFVGALLKIIRMVCPTHVAVLFDGECHNVRTELDSEYKANREDYSLLPEEDTPFSQLPDIFAALDYLGIRYAETTDCEADDWMAAFAVNNGGREVVIASQDSDLFQLITDKVHILRYRGEKTVLCNEQYIRQKLGIAPSQYAAFKALTGIISGVWKKWDPRPLQRCWRNLGTWRRSCAGRTRLPSPLSDLLCRRTQSVPG